MAPTSNKLSRKGRRVRSHIPLASTTDSSDCDSAATADRNNVPSAATAVTSSSSALASTAVSTTLASVSNVSRPKFKLRSHRTLIRVIPEGDFDVNLLTKGRGYCMRLGCDPKKQHNMLRQHFEGAHQKRPVSKPRDRQTLIRVIPATGEVDVNLITGKKGHCFIEGCDPSKVFWNLQQHYQLIHLNARTELLSIIPEDGDVAADKLTTTSGFCDMPECKKKITKLRDHFLGVHRNVQRVRPDRKVMKECPVCGKNFTADAISRHRRTHSDPVRCGICKFICISDSACYAHIWKKHPGSDRSNRIALTTAEIEEYKKATPLKRGPDGKRLRKDRLRINNMKEVLDEYEKRLLDPTDDICKRATRLAATFREMLQFGADEVIVNAGYVSIWDRIKKKPKVCMEIVEALDADGVGRGTTYHKDPKCDDPQPGRADFNGFHRGHLCAASNFRLIMLIAASNYYTNLVAMYMEFNEGMKKLMEIFVQELANEFGDVTVFHLVFTENDEKTDGPLGIAVPSSIGCVAVVEKANGRHLLGWELPHQKTQHVISSYICDPYRLFLKAGYTFRMPKSSFVFISKDLA